jgi:hypothetical protein
LIVNMTRTLTPIVAAALLLMSGTSGHAQSPQKITVNFLTRSGASWPLLIAKEGGYSRSMASTGTSCSRVTRPGSRWWSAAKRR